MEDTTQGTPEIVGEETIYTGRILSVDRLQVRLPTGRVVQRDVVEHNGSVVILPITADGRFILVRQYRLPARDTLLELPAGTIEENEEPEACALRELSEEIGQTAASMRRIAGFYLAPGWANEFMHAFVASGLSPLISAGDDDEDITLVTMTPEEAMDAIRSGRIIDCKTAALIGLYFAEQASVGGRPHDPWLHDNPDEPAE
jgi:ADP-ribose pyrophosphatase